MAAWTWVGEPNFVPSQLRAASGGSNSRAVRNAEAVVIEAVVSAITGTAPVLRLAAQFSWDQTNWVTVAEIVGANAAGRIQKVIPVQGPYFRLAWTIAGTFAGGQGVTFGCSLGWRE